THCIVEEIGLPASSIRLLLQFPIRPVFVVFGCSIWVGDLDEPIKGIVGVISGVASGILVSLG
ncbi:MAG: hypothetical protein ACP5QS_06260, partial [bacterium]